MPDWTPPEAQGWTPPEVTGHVRTAMPKSVPGMIGDVRPGNHPKNSLGGPPAHVETKGEQFGAGVTGGLIGAPVEQGSWPAVAGALLATAPFMLTGRKYGSEAIQALPSTERAGRNFETVHRVIGNAPVNSRPVIQATESGLETLKNRGSSAPPLLSRISEVGKTNEPFGIPFDVSREMQSGAGESSIWDRMTATPSQRRALGIVSGELSKANQGAADAAGVGRLYGDAMSEYKNAQRIKAIGKGALKVGTGAAIGGYGVSKLKQLGIPLP